MKTQKIGTDILFCSLMSIDRLTANYVAFREFKSNRSNGEDVDNPKNEISKIDEKIPEDGKYIWLRGEVIGGQVYGMKKKIKNKTFFHKEEYKYSYEVNYDAGIGDLIWFEKKDRNYLTRILKEGNLEVLEPAIWYLYMKDKTMSDIGEWWHQFLIKSHYYTRRGSEELDFLLAQAKKDKESLGEKELINIKQQKVVEEKKPEPDQHLRWYCAL